MEFKYYQFFLLLLLGCASCSPFQALHKDFNNEKSSIKYMYTSEVKPKREGMSLRVENPTITDRRFNFSDVRKTKAMVVPLIAINVWEYEYQCIVGKNQIKEELTPFIKSAFIEESSRSGIFVADTSECKYSLEMEVDSIASKGPYYNSGHLIYFLFVYSYQKREKAGPGLAYSRFHYRLKKGNEVISDNYVSSSASVEMITPRRIKFSRFHELYATNLVEALGETFKKNTELLVKRLNTLLENDSQISESSH